MRKEKILILDSNLDSAAILKQHVNSLGYVKVYLSANHEIVEDLFKYHVFQFVFINFETMQQWRRDSCPTFEKLGRQVCTVLMHWDYDVAVEGCMETMSVRHFMKKPFDINRVASILREGSKISA